MNTTKAAKRESICKEVRALARSFGVPEPEVQFDRGKTQYDTVTQVIELDGRAYNRVGRTLIYHEFAHHLCNIQLGMAQANHTDTFWGYLLRITARVNVKYPWHLEYESGRKYYERYIVPGLPPRQKARALFQAREYERLSSAA